MPTRDETLPGRDDEMALQNEHFVSGNPIKPPFGSNMKKIVLGLGCFWGAERKFWTLDGVYTTAVGYAAGFTPNPTYEEVCSGLTGHNEVVLVVYQSEKITLSQILRVFWESHDPTQGMRQGNDVGTQYRSGIYYDEESVVEIIEKSRSQYQTMLDKSGYGLITTEIIPLSEFYYAEQYHQQYLAKNPNGYCGLGGTGVDFIEL